MFPHVFTLLGLLAFTSAGVLELTPNTPGRVYLPASSSQQQTNTLTRTSQTFHVPAVVATYQQSPAVVSTIHHQAPATTNTFVNTLQKSAHVSTAQAPSVATSSFYPQQVTVNTVRSFQPAQFQQINYQQVPSTVFQQVPSTRQIQFGTQQVTSTANTNTVHRNIQPAYHSESTFQQVPVKQIAIVRLANENVGDGTYSYNYETENGITAEEHGRSNVAGAEIVERVHGSYSYTGPDNVRYTVNYVADENGYRAEGAHLPVPPTPVAQATARTSVFNSNVVNSQSAGVYVVPTTVVSQPLHIAPTTGAQSQRQASTVHTSYHQVPVIASQQSVNAVPTSTVTVNQQTSTDSVDTQSITVPSFAQQSSTGSFDSVQTPVHQHQSPVIPSTVTVQSGATGYNAGSAAVQRTAVQQSTVVPASTVNVQQGSSSYNTQLVGVSSFDAQLGQATVVPSVQGVNTQQFRQQSETQQVVQSQNAFAAGQVSTVQETNTQQHQGEVVPSTLVPSSTNSVQQGSTSEQSGVVRNTLVPSNRVSIQAGAVPSGVTPVHLGRTGLIKQQGIIQASASVQPQSSGVSTSHVTVQYGSAGYATEQVGDISSVQVYGNSPVQTVVIPANANSEQANQQAGGSQSQQVVQGSNAVPNTGSEHQTSSSNQGASVSQGVVLPDGSVHNGY